MEILDPMFVIFPDASVEMEIPEELILVPASAIDDLAALAVNGVTHMAPLSVRAKSVLEILFFITAGSR